MPLAPVATEVKVRTEDQQLDVQFEDGSVFSYSFEYLRVYSPSAEVRGHSPDDAILQVGKRNVSVKKVVPVGHYALQIEFDDGHSTGIYSWEWLYDLGLHRDTLWAEYLTKLEQSGASREPR